MSTHKSILFVFFMVAVSMLNEKCTGTEVVCDQLCYYDSKNIPHGCRDGCQCVAHDWNTGTVNMSGRCMHRMG
uniref:Putative secreted peptide n=1 Tax=Rhipicephalus pulchellus TaxID=72859 RepID=L7MCK2_RHIPC